MRRQSRWLISILAVTAWFFATPLRFSSVAAQEAGREEPVAVSICRLIESAAAAHGLPLGFLTRLIWQESSFRPHVVSPAGAQGIAQFMPGTAAERGLADPFDPEAAIPKAAELLADLQRRFGNLGLAAAAYNAGPGRVTGWRAGGYLPAETRHYVLRITRRSPEDWNDPDIAAQAMRDMADEKSPSCQSVVAQIRRNAPLVEATTGFLAPWGVQLAGNFSKAIALASFARTRARHTAILNGIEPMILGSRLRSRGARPFYRARAPAATRSAANELCPRLIKAGGACVVLKS